MRASILLCGLTLLSSAAAARDSAPHAQSSTLAVFKQLASVTGEWNGSQDGHPVKVTYALTGDGSALMETVVPVEAPGSTMITMFTVDRDRLIATHYCAAHNQPQMTAESASDLSKGVAFHLTRITGMKTAADWHNTGLTFVLDDANHITQHWTFAYKGKPGANTFHYTRAGQ
jgi:hypothetical protein